MTSDYTQLARPERAQYGPTKRRKELEAANV